MREKNLNARDGYLNRHIDGLPKEKCIIKLIQKDFEGEHVFACDWLPFVKSNYKVVNMPASGYLGTAVVVREKPYKGIGFHAWEQNDSEFIYYQVV